MIDREKNDKSDDVLQCFFFSTDLLIFDSVHLPDCQSIFEYLQFPSIRSKKRMDYQSNCLHRRGVLSILNRHSLGGFFMNCTFLCYVVKPLSFFHLFFFFSSVATVTSSFRVVLILFFSPSTQIMSFNDRTTSFFFLVRIRGEEMYRFH